MTNVTSLFLESEELVEAGLNISRLNGGQGSALGSSYYGV